MSSSRPVIKVNALHLEALGPIALAVLVGAVGGAAFNWINLPLAWMIGAMVFTTAGALAGMRVRMPHQMRGVMIVVLGVMLGSAFTPEIVERAGRWLFTLATLALYASVVAVVTAFYFRRVARFDPVTAYFAAAPGGLTEMTLIGGALGGDDRTISLIHSARVLLIVLTVPFWFRLLEDYDMAQRAAVGMSFAEITLAEIGILSAAGVVGVLVAKAARIPAALLTGPMIVSAAIHVTGITASRPPNELVAIAQVIVGAAIGCRFAGLPVRHVLRTLLVGSGAIAIMLCGTVAFSLGLHHLTGVSIPALVLSFAPGGLAEMSLIALALGVDAAFVSTHHVMRIALVVIIAPMMYRLLNRKPR